jgi:hypothetical protein
MIKANNRILLERIYIMIKKDGKLEIKSTITKKDKIILNKALNGICGWRFIPIFVIINGIEDYYFICKVKTIIKSTQMKIAKIYIKVQKDMNPKLLSIEEII